MILLLGLGAVLACVGVAAWKIYGRSSPSNHALPASPEQNSKNWVATDFIPHADSASPPSENPAETSDSSA